MTARISELLDLRFVREHLELVRRKTEERQSRLDFGMFASLDARRRDMLARVEQLRRERNEASQRISRKDLPRDERKSLIDRMRTVSDEVKSLEKELRAVETQLSDFMRVIPNLSHDDVPVGKDESCNVEVRRWGERPEFDFEPRAHWDLGPALDI